MKIKYSVSFYLERRLINGVRPTENLRIRMRVSYNSLSLEIPLSCRIDENKWDKDNSMALPRAIDKYGNTTRDVNNEIELFREGVEKAFAKFELIEDRIPTKDELKTTFNEIIGKKAASKAPSENIYTAFNRFLTEGKEQWAEGTYKKMRTVQKHLKEYDKDLQFINFNDTFFKDYINHLSTKKKFRNSTVLKQIRLIKWFLNWSVENKLNTNTDYKTFSPKLKNVEKKVIFLTWDELMRVNSIELPEEKAYLGRVRDVFCFCCFTSLRYSDAYNLKKHNITDNSINIVTVKTNDTLIIELNKYSKAILDKYKDVPLKNDKALPVISNQKMNTYLKELGKLAELNAPEPITYYIGNKRIDEVVPKHELLTTHCARRTFICNALSLGIPAQVVMQWTGHADYSAMKPYIAIADSTKSESMKKFDL